MTGNCREEDGSAVFFFGEDFERLRQKLHKGMQIHARIIKCFETQRYLLRILGYNIVMRSELAFKQFEEVKLVVKDTFPYLVLASMNLNKNNSLSISKPLDGADPKIDMFV